MQRICSCSSPRHYPLQAVLLYLTFKTDNPNWPHTHWLVPDAAIDAAAHLSWTLALAWCEDLTGEDAMRGKCASARHMRPAGSASHLAVSVSVAAAPLSSLWSCCVTLVDAP